MDTQALLAALHSRHITAALDVTDPEPLPPDHLLWKVSMHTRNDSAKHVNPKPRLQQQERSVQLHSERKPFDGSFSFSLLNTAFAFCCLGKTPHYTGHVIHGMTDQCNETTHSVAKQY